MQGKRTFCRKGRILLLTGVFLLSSFSFAQPGKTFRVNGGKVSLEFNNQLASRVISRLEGKDLVLGGYSASEFLKTADGKTLDKFSMVNHSESPVQDKIGKGKEYRITGKAQGMTKEIRVVSYDEFPNFLFLTVSYTNNSKSPMGVESWTNNSYNFSSKPVSEGKPSFWSYQPGSYGWDNDWLQQINKGFKRENHLGMNNVDYGGGTPIVDIWRQDVGLAVGHVELVPKMVCLPTSADEKGANIAIKYKNAVELKPGDKMTTFRTFVSVHKGDYFPTLTDFSNYMAKQGIDFKEAPKSAYQTEWCAWGFEKDFTMSEFYGAFPMVKKLGLDVITLDYGWESAVGDYYLPKDKFPNGDADMKRVADSIHALGLQARLWWMPLSVYPKTDMFTEHPDYMILNKDQSPVIIQFWKSFFLCPGSEDVKKATKEFVIKAIRDWGFDGLKIDGNNLNTVPACYNPAHKHARPEESVEQLPELYKIIYETALSIKPDAVIQICPCGTNQSFYVLPYMNQTVASDPHSSWHVRIKGKTLHGLTRSKAVYAGDHVELSDDKSDFASTVGIGGVIATKFVWPVGSHENKETGDIALTPEKEKIWSKWVKIYHDNMLTEGTYKGELYDIGYDRPEAHAIQKDNNMYYAFYGRNFNGEVELRGLENKTYKVVDYENGKELGTVRASGSAVKMPVKFEKHLLLKAVPVNN